MTKAQAKRLAIMADDGLARAIRPAHAPMDGDTVFAVATLRKPMRDDIYHLTEIGLAAADCLARAIARGVYEATALPFPGALPAWKDLYASEGIGAMSRTRIVVAVLIGAALLALLSWQLHRERLVKACLRAAAPGTAPSCGPPRLRPILRRDLQRS